MVQDPKNYSSDNKRILSGTSCFNWSTSDPQGIIDDAKDAVSSKIAQDPNTMVIGQDAWRLLKRHPKLKDLISDNTNKLVNAISTLRDIQKGVISLQAENDLLETSSFNAQEYKTNKSILDKLFGKQKMNEY